VGRSLRGTVIPARIMACTRGRSGHEGACDFDKGEQEVGNRRHSIDSKQAVMDLARWLQAFTSGAEPAG
jgi:hypothetical protein